MSLPEPELTWLGSPLGAGEALPPLDGRVSQQVLHNVPARVAIFGRDYRYLFCNREMLDFHGKRSEDMIGRHVRDVLGADIFAIYETLTERVWGGEVLRWEGWLEFPRLGKRYVQTLFLPCVSEGQAVETVSAFARDLTDLKLREQDLAAREAQLEASEALKSAIVDHALAAFISTDALGVIVEFNPAAEAMFGYSRADVVGRLVGETIVPERFRSMHEAGMRRMREGGAPHIMGKRVEMPALRADGTEFQVEMVLWQTNVAGTVFYTSSLFDVTERQRAQEQIERQRNALRQSEKLSTMGSLLAGVAHELNNPLSIVLGRAMFLEERCDDAALIADARRIREAAERCGRIVRTFLNMARDRPARRSLVSLNDLVLATIDMLTYSIRSHGIALKLELEPKLASVSGDGDQIGQVILNLLVNAQQALVHVGAPRCVTVQTGLEARDDGQRPRVWVRVVDNGPGVGSELSSRIFEPFFTTKAEGVGTGIGLAVSRSIAREHGGELLLEPPSGEGGAAFRMLLPTVGSTTTPQVARYDATESFASATGKRILVVDDEAEVGALMRDVLEAAGYEVVTAESGALAIAMLEAATFDAIVSDLHMPDSDGAALWRHLNDHSSTLAKRLLFVTGDTLSPSASEFLQTSRCMALDKPFSNAELVAGVTALLTRTTPLANA